MRRPFWTLLKKECLRFWAARAQTLFAPIIMSTLFLFIFGLSLGRRIQIDTPYTYLEFVIPGLILMGVINNAFANSSSSLFFSRYIGNVVDLLVTPLTPTQMILAYTLAAMLRALLVGTGILLVASTFATLPWAYPAHAIAMVLLTAFTLSQLGLIAAIYCDTFESISMYNNFLLLPMVYLGGMFYPTSILPPFWQRLTLLNPIFYTIDGFRQSVLGTGDVAIQVCYSVLGAFALVLFIWAFWLFQKGYRLRT